MIDADTLFRRYKELRRKGHTARSAARAVIRPVEKPTVDWTGGAATIEIGPYTVDLKQEYDDDPDLSYLGRYSDTPRTDTITRRNAGRNDCRYWNPAYTLAETYHEYHSAGLSKADAWIKALESRERAFNRMEGYCRNYWTMIGITATARIDGMTCGTTSLWGIESDDGDYIDQLAHELAGEAVAAAEASRDTMIHARAQEIATLATIPRGTV